MRNRHTLKFSLLAAALLALSLPVAASAQWGGYPDNRDYGRSGRYDDRYVKETVQRLDRLAKDFERDMDRALDRSRVNGTDREDRINGQVHQFKNSVGDLKSRVGNGRDLDRSSNEARRVFSEAQQVDRIARPRWFDGQLSSQWSQIQRELRVLSDIYGVRYNGGGGYGRDDDYRRGDDNRRRDDDYRRRDNRNNRNDDWWRRIPFPR